MLFGERMRDRRVPADLAAVAGEAPSNHWLCAR